MKEYDYKAIPHKERLTTLCGIALNQYNVIHIDIQQFVSKYPVIKDMVAHLTKELLFDVKMEMPDVTLFDETDLVRTLKDIFSQKREKFIFIIDEWDSIFRVHRDNAAAQKEYLDFLRDLLKGQPYVALAYMTDILPIKKYGQHSALNMFKEYAMTNQYALAKFTGFTEREVRQLCERYHMSFEQTKDWYDGYNVNGVSIYNPRSVTSAMMNGIFDSYWTQTETYEALKMYIVRNENGLRDKIIRMIAGEHISINTKTFQNDMCTFETADDILTLLVHLGYLTYDFDTKTAWIPNKEVRQEFLNSIQGQEFQTVNNAIHRSDKLLQLTLAQNAEKVAEMLQEVHCDNCSVIQYNIGRTSMFNSGLEIGQIIKNEDIVRIFKCGNMGGMRRSRTTNTLVIVSDYTKGLYHDKWIGGILHYTGMGKSGDQDIHWASMSICSRSLMLENISTAEE